jgi:signal transduction histidine kinase
MHSVRHSAELGGSVGVESVPGMGSTFRVCRPLRASHAARQPASDQ